MRTISADHDKILTGGARQIAHRIQVKDAGGTFRDLSTYPGVDLIEQLEWSEDLDNPGVTWSATLTREQEQISLAPMMENSPLNRGFNPAASYAALLQVGRRMKVEFSMQAEDDPRARTWSLAFEGYIDKVNSGGGDTVSIEGRGLEAAIINAYIKRERIYAYAQGANADRGCYVWTPSTVWVVGDRLVPTDSKANQHFYRVTTGGTGGTTEPTWPTGGGSTVADGSAVFTESGATSTSATTDVEAVMQQILDDTLGAGVVTLWCPVSPVWSVRWFLVSRQPTFDELKTLADQIGWCVRFMDDAGTPKLKFFDPDRATTTSLRSFGPTSEVEDYKRLSTDWQGIRNAIRVVYSDSQDLDPAGNPKRKTVDRTDAASQTKYGELFAEIAEATNSNIDTAAEAQALADAVLSDLAEPTADMEAALLFFFAFVEVCDLYTFTADGVHFDSDQKLAVVGFTHSVSAEETSTSIRVRGKPASNGKKGWFERFSDAEGAEQHALTVVENVAPLTLAADSTPVGGVRLSLVWNGTKAPKDTHFELHLSTAPGFTASAATLAATGKDRSFEVGNLDPAVEHYAQVIPITFNDGRAVRGQPSTEIPFTPGRAQATHLNSDVEWGRLPLNGGFETQLDPAGPPDFWTMGGGGFSGTWGAQAFLLTDGSGISGAAYLKLLSASAFAGAAVTSAFFNINERRFYAPSFWRKAVSGAGTVNVAIIYYDQDHAITGGSVNETFSLASSVGTWVQHLFAATLPPAGSRFARISLIVPLGVGQECHFDDVRLEEDERWHTVGATSEPAYANSWVAHTAGTNDLQFRREGQRWGVFRGAVKNGSSATATICTLATDYRPLRPVVIPIASNGAYGEITISTAGVVAASVGNTTKLSLDGARWPLD